DAHQVIQLHAVGRDGWNKTVTLRRDLSIASATRSAVARTAARVVDPHCALTTADRRDEGTAVTSEFDALFLSRAEGDLFGRSIRDTLAPDVKPAAGICGEIHPLSIGRPGSVCTLRRRTDEPSGRATVEGRQSTGQPGTLEAHLDHEDLLPIGRDVGAV